MLVLCVVVRKLISINMTAMYNFQDAPLGFYDSVQDTFGREITFNDYLNATAPRYLQGQEKRSLPCITVGGVFNRRKLGGLIKPSGIVQVDIDAKDNGHVTDWERVKQAAAMVDGLELMVAISASGSGVFGLYFDPLLLLAFEQRGADAYLMEQKKLADCLTDEVEQLTGCVADRSVVNRPNGLRFVTADKNPIVFIEEVEMAVPCLVEYFEPTSKSVSSSCKSIN